MTQQNIGALLKLITDKIKTTVDGDLKEKNLTFSQSNVLNYLYHHGNESTQKEIEKYLGVSHPAVAGIVSRLEKNGFVYSYPDPADRRNKIVGLTNKAKDISSEMQKDMIFREKSLIHGLTKEETENLRRMLITIYENLDKYAE